MRPELDVVIVGGGPAGLSTALFATHLSPSLSKRLVVLEKERYPREKICAGGVGGRADRALASIGVQIDVPSVYARGFSVKLRGETIERRHRDKRTVGRVIRRAELDAGLAKAAEERGIDIRQHTRVLGISRMPEGITVHTSNGDLTTRVLIGADGVGSVVRRELGLAQGTWRAQVLEIDTEPTEHDPPADLLHFDVSDPTFAGYAWDFPTIVDGRQLVSRGVYQLHIPGSPPAPNTLNDRLSKRLAAIGLDLTKYRKKRFAERGFAPHEPVAMPRALLVGEAAGIDPITGEGIAQAVQYGQVVAPYLINKLDQNAMIFDDWASYLSRTKLGLDLHLREQLARRFFGAPREFFEHSLLAVPEFLEAGMQYFAGEPVSRSLMLKIGLTMLKRGWEHRQMKPWEGLDASLTSPR